jgi:hypothetical protein
MLSRMTGFGGLGRSTHRLDSNELSLDLVLINLESAFDLREAGVIPARARRCNRGRSTH